MVALLSAAYRAPASGAFSMQRCRSLLSISNILDYTGLQIKMRKESAGSGDDPVPASTWQYIRDPRIADQYDAYFRYNELFRFDTILLDKLLCRPGALVDFGCGTGRHVAHFSRRGFRVCGIDLSSRMLGISKEKLSPGDRRRALIQAHVSRAPLGANRFEVIWHITLKFLRPALIGAGAVAFLMSFENFNTTLFLVGYEATLPINLYLQVRDGSTPVINAISFLLIVGPSLLALINLYFSRKGESS